MGNIIHINDINCAELDVYARLTEAQLKNRRNPEQGLFVAESAKVISHALDAGYEPVSFLMEQRQMEGQGQSLLERCPQVPVYTASREMLATLTGYELTRGMLCAMRRPKLKTPEEVCASASRVAVLEGIVDPTNVGAIMRSAAALHMDAVLLSPNCCDPLHRRAVRVSMGTVFQIPWAYMRGTHTEWLEHGVEQLHQLGFETVAMALVEDAIQIDEPCLQAAERLAILLGTEGNGLCPSTIAASTYQVYIPMSHHVDSLNVAAASAVAFWQLRKLNREKGL